MFFGGEYVLNQVNSTGVTEDISAGIKQSGPSRYPKSDWSSLAVYINNNFNLNEKTILQAGLRYNQFLLNADFDTSFYSFPYQNTSLNNGAITGSLGMVYRPTETWILSSNFGTAFRSPNVDDIGKVFDSEPGSVVIPNPDLTAEYAYNVDVGIAKVFGNSVKADLTVFYTILDNAMVRRNFQLNGKDSVNYDGTLSQVQALQNGALSRVFGIQAGFEIKLPKGFTISANANYQLGEEELDNGDKSPSRHAAPFFGISRLSYVSNKLSLQFYAQFQAERKFVDLAVEEQGKTEIYALDKNGKPYAPSWYTLNLKANYLLTPIFSVSAGLENITDQRYRSYSSGISAPGRNYIMSLNAKF